MTTRRFLGTLAGQAIILVAIVSLLGAVRGWRYTQYLAERKTLTDRAAHQRLTSLRKKWNAAQYVPASPINVRHEITNRLRQVNLHPKQKQLLEPVMIGLFEHLSAPTFESYLQYKTQNCNFRILFDGAITQKIARKVLQGHHFPNAPEDRLREAWSIFHGSASAERTKIVAVAPDTIRILVERKRGLTGSTPARAVGICPLARAAINPGIHVLSEGAMSELASCTNTFAEIIFLAQVNCAPNCGPILANFFWDPTNETWMPWSLYSDSGLLFECCF